MPVEIHRRPVRTRDTRWVHACAVGPGTRVNAISNMNVVIAARAAVPTRIIPTLESR